MAQKEWCDLLEKNTTGKMKCNILPARCEPRRRGHDGRGQERPGRRVLHGPWLHSRPLRATRRWPSCPFLGDKARAAVGGVPAASPASTPSSTAEHQKAGREAAGLLHARSRHHLQHQAAHCQGGRPAGPEVPRGAAAWSTRSARSLGMNVTLKPAPDSYELLVGRRHGRHAVPGRVHGIVQDRQDHQARHGVPRAACTTRASCS
jgi:hypothetical protein